MTIDARDTAQLMLPVLDPPEAVTASSPGKRRETVIRVVERKAASTATRPLDERYGTRPTLTESGDPTPVADAERLLLTVPEAARALHIGRRQAWELVWRGELPVVRLGRSVRIARPVLERFVAERSLPYGA